MGQDGRDTKRNRSCGRTGGEQLWGSAGDKCSAVYTLPQSLILPFPLTPSMGELVSRWHQLLRVILKNKMVKRSCTNGNGVEQMWKALWGWTKKINSEVSKSTQKSWEGATPDTPKSREKLFRKCTLPLIQPLHVLLWEGLESLAMLSTEANFKPTCYASSQSTRKTNLTLHSV